MTVHPLTIRGGRQLRLVCSVLVLVCTSVLAACGVLEVGIEPAALAVEPVTLTAEQVAPALPTPFPSPTLSPQMPLSGGKAITSFATTPDGALWYAFDDFDGVGGTPPGNPYHGLYRSLEGQVSRFDVPGTIRVLAVAPDGSLYIGAGRGVLRYANSGLTTLADVERGVDTFTQGFVPYDIAFGQDGVVWVGGVYSLARLDGKGWTQYDVNVRRLLVAPDESIWGEGWDGAAGSDCCFIHITGDTWVTYTHSAVLPVPQELLDDIRALRE
jgi:streptogramin lyase